MVKVKVGSHGYVTSVIVKSTSKVTFLNPTNLLDDALIACSRER